LDGVKFPFQIPFLSSKKKEETLKKEETRNCPPLACEICKVEEKRKLFSEEIEKTMRKRSRNRKVSLK
jgi:hypothetical protein